MNAKIVALDGEEGLVELSLSEAGKQKIWQRAKDLAESGETVVAKVAASNAGGLMITIEGGDKGVPPRLPAVTRSLSQSAGWRSAEDH